MNVAIDLDAERSLGQRFRSLCSACRQVFGMPDYERYLAHAQAQHPGAPVLSRNDYCAKVIERRYGQGVGRCC
ncbi:YbdD/YjiX family protein [Variovorax sp. J22P271]|uniref:YbdD/YjiX family protein n=1 Tax=Variovorax davisae TaxID=3053515 RepID=UPI00257536B9|nr:YbdD/YjiX family protein [Variovorax sp. J22P271]MDM0035453.1 YbdD/YjiX family protein [Variovorax sp. J22P271]